MAKNPLYYGHKDRGIRDFPYAPERGRPMQFQEQIPREGELHSVVNVGGYAFELRYGFNLESERASGEPFVLYPNLAEEPKFTPEGYRIVSAIQSVCGHYEAAPGMEPEDCCYTCRHYPDPVDDIGVCRCEKMRNGGVR